MSYEAKQAEKDIVARNLRELLKQKNKKQIDLVRDLDFSQSIVSEYLNGKKYPAPDKMQILADYFGVYKSDIMQEKPATKSDDGLSEKQRKVRDSLMSLEDPVLLKQALEYIEFLKSKRNS